MMDNSEDLCTIIKDIMDNSSMEQLFAIPELDVLYEKVEEKQRENPGLEIDDALKYLSCESNNTVQQEDKKETYEQALYLLADNDDFLYADAPMDDVCPYGSPLANNVKCGSNLQFSTHALGVRDEVTSIDVDAAPREILLPQLQESTRVNAKLTTMSTSERQLEGAGSEGPQRSRRHRAANTRHGAHTPHLVPQISHSLQSGASLPSNYFVPVDEITASPSLLGNFTCQESEEMSKNQAECRTQQRCSMSPGPNSRIFHPSQNFSHGDQFCDMGARYAVSDEVQVSSPSSPPGSQVWSPYASPPPVLEGASPMSSSSDFPSSSSCYSPCAASPRSDGLHASEDAHVRSTGARSKRMPRMSLSGLTEEEKKSRVRGQNNKASRDYRERRKEKNSFLETSVRSLENERSVKQHLLRDLQMKISTLKFYFESRRKQGLHDPAYEQIRTRILNIDQILKSHK